MPDFVITAVLFVLILSVLVFIHEFGHYMVARLIGVWVQEFGFGLPPRAFGKKFGKTIYSLNWLPIGGFVRLAGEDEEDIDVKELKKKAKGDIHQYFWARSKKERAAILLAGVTMNFLLAYVINVGLLIHGIEDPAPWVKIEAVVAGTPAETAGIKVEDRIQEVTFTDANGTVHTLPTRIPDELVQLTRQNLGKEITLHVIRGTSKLTLAVTPRAKFPDGEGPMGVKIGYDVVLLKSPPFEAPIAGIGYTVRRAKDMLVSLATLPSRAMAGQKVQDEVAGPIGIAKITGMAIKIGPIAVFNLMSILSLSLALLNFLPIPALDGGRLLFVAIEAVIGKKVKPDIERVAHQIGMFVLLLFILLVTLNDITKLFKGI